MGLRTRVMAVVATTVVAVAGSLYAVSASEAAVIGTAGTLTSSASGRCLTVLGASTNPGSGVVVFDCNGGANQSWTLTAANEVRVYSGGNVRCLDADNNGTGNGTRLIIWNCSGAANQKFALNDNGTLRGTQSGRCADVSGGGSSPNNTSVVLWDCKSSDNANQTWTQPGGTPPTNPGTTACASTSVPARSDLLQTTVTNNTGKAGAVYLYNLGEMGGRRGWVNAAGGFTAWPAGGLPPTPAPDASMSGPANGSSVQIRIPRNLVSGRLYFSIGKKIDFRLTPDGLVQPAPWAGGDPNKDVLFDTSEYTFNDNGLWLNSSQVDMFAIPHIVSVTDGAGKCIKTGELKPGGRNAVINAIRGQSAFAGSIVNGSDGSVIRVLAPGKAADAGLMSATYLDSYINTAWAAYTNRTLTVVPREAEPNRKFMGRTSGNTMVFTDTSGAQVATVGKPTSANVWGCDGVFNAPNVPPFNEPEIKRTLCTALIRGTLGSFDVEPNYNSANFYKNSAPNMYSKLIHENMIDGKAYGFAYDDVGHFESLVNAGDPRLASIVLSPF
jgi:hypothetical protein